MLRRIALAVAGTCCAVLISSPLAAYAEKGTGSTTPNVSGNTVTITLTGNGVKGGSPGSGGSTTVTKPTPCGYIQGMTGKEYYDYVKGGGPLGRDTEGRPFEPNPGYEQYKDDTEGHWYGGMCSSETFGDLDDFFEYSDQWFDEHDAVYVPAGGQPPVAPVPPQVLRDAAFEAMTVPAPAIDWNPKHTGDAASVVNLDTWVWLKDREDNRFVQASVNTMAGTLTARVDANLTNLTVSAPNANTVTCAGLGTPYAAGATTDCAIRFLKASPGQSATPVTAQTTWKTTWFSSQDPTVRDTPNALAPQTSTTNIRVLEIQAVTR